MPDYVIPAPPMTAVPVAGGGLFPVRRIFCVGRNYAAHVREMGGDPDREAPFFFTKPADALVTQGADMPYPPATSDMHHEMELVVAIGAGGAACACCVWTTAACSSAANDSPKGKSFLSESPTRANCSERPARRCISPPAVADQASLAATTRFLAWVTMAGSNRPSTLDE